MSDTAAEPVTPDQEAAVRQATFHDHIISKLRGRIGDLEVEMAAMQVRYEYLVAEVEQERAQAGADLQEHVHAAPTGAPVPPPAPKSSDD